MKSLSLFVSAAALLSASSAFAADINCATPPTCESLGYTDTISQCPNKSVKCPFDVTKGTCLHEAAVGEIAYFPGRAPLGKGWLPCDGSSYPKSLYPELAEFLENAPVKDDSSKSGNPFCESAAQKYHGTCSSINFAVPDYRGYFLRVAGMWRGGDSTNWNANFLGQKQSGRVTSINTPQAEELPNITGAGGFWEAHNNAPWTTQLTGAFYRSSGKNFAGSGDADTDNYAMNFDASRTEGSGKGVYKEGGRVIPANYSVYAYIYAGRVVNK